MSRPQHHHFRESVENLIWSDHRLCGFEYVVRSVLLRHLDPNFGRSVIVARPPTGRLTEFMATVLSELAWEGQDDEAAARKAFDLGMGGYG